MEEWKVIPSFSAYEISTCGRVRRMKPAVGARVGHVVASFIFGRYARVKLYDGPNRADKSVHELVMEAFVGPRPIGMQINHKNGDKLCNKEENLEYVTPKQNTQHAIVIGLRDRIRGEHLPWSKLTPEKVKEIRISSETGAYLARKFGVSQSAISQVRKRLWWRHVA